MNEFFDKIKEDASNLWQRTREAAAQLKEREEEGMQYFHNLYAWADGSLTALPFEQKEPSEKDQKMKTLAVLSMTDDVLAAPCNGIVVGISPKNNTIAISPSADEIVAIKVCTGHVNFEKEAKILVKKGQWVHTGQMLARFDKPVESRSKLLLVSPKTWQEYVNGGAAGARQSGPVSKGDLLIAQPASKTQSGKDQA